MSSPCPKAVCVQSSTATLPGLEGTLVFMPVSGVSIEVALDDNSSNIEGWRMGSHTAISKWRAFPCGNLRHVPTLQPGLSIFQTVLSTQVFIPNLGPLSKGHLFFPPGVPLLSLHSLMEKHEREGTLCFEELLGPVLQA